MKTFCPSCEKETNCVYIAELYECKECGCDFESKQRQMQERLDAANTRAEAAEARAERLENELSEVVAYGGYYADIENRLPPEGQVVKVIASSTHGVDDFTVLRMNEKWYFASDPPREVPGKFEVIRIKPWDVKRFGASYDEEF